VDFTRQVVGINLQLSVADTSAAQTTHTWKTLIPRRAMKHSSAQSGNRRRDAFYASSNQGATGPGVLTVTVDAGTVSAATVRHISGQLTGMGFQRRDPELQFVCTLPSPGAPL